MDRPRVMVTQHERQSEAVMHNPFIFLWNVLTCSVWATRNHQWGPVR